MRFDKKSRNQQAKGVGRPLSDTASRRAIRLRCGLVTAVTRGLRDSEKSSKIKRARDAGGSDRGRVDVVVCGPFPMGELDLDCEAFWRGLHSPTLLDTRSTRMSVRSPRLSGW